MKKHGLARILTAILLAGVMLAGIVALAADTATTITLGKTEGKDVSVLSKTGKGLTISNNMKLFNGYTIKSGLASYAYLNLDSTKAAKLDASSEAEVRQSGKKLEINLKTGSLFFNISEKLGDDESLNIRTSTMVTGIRGTAGWVEVVNERITKIYLLTGEVIIIVTDPNTHETTYEIVRAGESATGYINDETPDADVEAEIERTKYVEDDIPGFVAIEILNSDELQQRLRDDGLLDVNRILENARRKLAEDQANAAKKRTVIIDKNNALENTVRRPVWEEAVTTTTAVAPASPSGTITLSAYAAQYGPPANPGYFTAAEVQAIYAAGYTGVTVDNGAYQLNITGSTLTIAPGQTLTNQGTITGAGGVIQNNSNTSYINTINGTVEAGVILVNGYASSSLPGHMELNGIIQGRVINELGDLTITGKLMGATAELNVDGGTVELNSPGIIDTALPITVDAGATFTLDGGNIYSSATPNMITLSGGTFVLESGGLNSANGSSNPFVGGTGNIENNSTPGSVTYSTTEGELPDLANSGDVTVGGSSNDAPFAGLIRLYEANHRSTSVIDPVTKLTVDVPPPEESYIVYGVYYITKGRLISGTPEQLFNSADAGTTWGSRYVIDGGVTIDKDVVIDSEKNVTLFFLPNTTAGGGNPPGESWLIIDGTLTNNGTLNLVGFGEIFNTDRLVGSGTVTTNGRFVFDPDPMDPSAGTVYTSFSGIKIIGYDEDVDVSTEPYYASWNGTTWIADIWNGTAWIPSIWNGNVCEPVTP